MSIIALIRSALEAVIALPKLFDQIERLIAVIEQQSRMRYAETKIRQLELAIADLAKATTPEQRIDALKNLAKSTNA